MKLFLLACILNCFLSNIEPQLLEKGESAWVTGPLSDSYENEILASIGLPVCGKSLEEYRRTFSELGLELEHLEINKEMVLFESIEELRNWIFSQVGSLDQTEQYLSAMQKKGWINVGAGKIGFPRKQLVACVRAK